MSVETKSSFVELDLSMDERVIKKAKSLMGEGRTSPEVAREWIESPVKAGLERALIGGLGTVLTSPLVGLALAGVYVKDRNPLFYELRAGFLGQDSQIVEGGSYLKIRSLKKGVARAEEQHPLRTTAFQGGRKRAQPEVDPRVHSWVGAKIRKTGVDELPQLWAVLKGEMAAISPRAYTFAELEGLKLLFNWQEKEGNLFPPNFPTDYRAVVSRFRSLKPGLFSLYTATLKKDLTITERLMLDYLYLTQANWRADVRIILATAQATLQGVGAR